MLEPYVLLAKVIAVVALLSAIVFGVHLYNTHFEDIGYQKAVSEYSAKLIAAQESAQKETAALNQKIQEANNAANRRNKQIDAAHAAAQSANDSLQHTLDTYRDSVSGATAATLAGAVRTLTDVFGECSSSITGLAKTADRWESDSRRCVESWPKVGTPP